jgi:hypothetical protein
MFPGEPWEDRWKFHEAAHVWIKQKRFDANATWDERLKMCQALEELENLPPFDEKALKRYLSSAFMCNCDKVGGDMNVGDYIALMREQNFRDMNFRDSPYNETVFCAHH